MTTAMIERGDLASGAHQHVMAEMRAAVAACKRLGARTVRRGLDGTWRAAAPWAGSGPATESADRKLRLQLAERSLRSTGPDADRRRRLKLAALDLGAR